MEGLRGYVRSLSTIELYWRSNAYLNMKYEGYRVIGYEVYYLEIFEQFRRRKRRQFEDRAPQEGTVSVLEPHTSVVIGLLESYVDYQFQVASIVVLGKDSATGERSAPLQMRILPTNIDPATENITFDVFVTESPGEYH